MDVIGSWDASTPPRRGRLHAGPGARDGGTGIGRPLRRASRAHPVPAPALPERHRAQPDRAIRFTRCVVPSAAGPHTMIGRDLDVTDFGMALQQIPDAEPVRRREHGVVPDREPAEARALSVMRPPSSWSEALAESAGPSLEARPLYGRREHAVDRQLELLLLAVGERGALHVAEDGRAQSSMRILSATRSSCSRVDLERLRRQPAGLVDARYAQSAPTSRARRAAHRDRLRQVPGGRRIALVVDQPSATVFAVTPRAAFSSARCRMKEMPPPLPAA